MFFKKYYNLPISLFKKIIIDLKKEAFTSFLHKIINEKDTIFLDMFYLIPEYNYEKTSVREKEFQKINFSK